jgi:hypothetical protein
MPQRAGAGVIAAGLAISAAWKHKPGMSRHVRWCLAAEHVDMDSLRHDRAVLTSLTLAAVSMLALAAPSWPLSADRQQSRAVRDHGLARFQAQPGAVEVHLYRLGQVGCPGASHTRRGHRLLPRQASS